MPRNIPPTFTFRDLRRLSTLLEVASQSTENERDADLLMRLSEYLIAYPKLS